VQPLLSSDKAAALYGSRQVHEDNIGSIQFSFEYDMDTSILTVELLNASELSSPDQPSYSLPNPYVVVTLLPDVSNQPQTRTHRQTRSPCLEERFVFEVSWSELSCRSLQLRVFHDTDDDSRRHHQCLGHVLLPLDQLDLSTKCVMCKGLSADEKQASE